MRVPKGRQLGTLLTLLLLASCVLPAQVTQPPGPAPPAPVRPAGGPVTTIPTEVVTTLVESTTGGDLNIIAEVVSVTDGDTIRVHMPDGTNEPVRLIGIDAPEDGSLLDHQATDYLEELVLGEDVRMVVDVSDRDRFDRLLRYIYVGDLFVNEEMVRVGLAIAKRYQPDTAMASVLEAAQVGAEQGALGLFSVVATTSIGTTTTVRPTTTTRPSTTTTTTTLATTTATTVPANCHPSYPDFCIPPPPPDLNCGDIGAQDFTVLAPDPHGFDGNNDGAGCES